MELPKMDQPVPQPEEAAHSRGIWSSILTATPVVLTVVATLLAGLSNSEMTLAQYHRAAAAQNQSKAGDQWNFFQAKRIRGTNLEMTIDMLHASAQPAQFQVAALTSSADRWLQELRRAQKDLGSLAAAKSSAANTIAQLTQESIARIERTKQRMSEELARPDMQQAIACLTATKLPPVSRSPVEDPRIVQALEAIRSRRPDEETLALVRNVPEEAIQHAIVVAETNVENVEQVDKPVSESLARLDSLLHEQQSTIGRFTRAVRDADDALASSPEHAKSLAALTRCSANIKRISEELAVDFKAAQHTYTAQRYEREARCNEDAAGLYEVQVRKSTASSERHRARSKHFFYGMLAAQAGVMIATFSLAVRHKSVLWSLATLAGIGAILFGLYVYLYV